MTRAETVQDGTAPGGGALARAQTHQLLGQVMGLVPLTVGCTALGAYIGRDLGGGVGLLLFIAAFGCISGSTSRRHAATSNSRSGCYTIFDFNRLRRSGPDAAVPIAARIFLDVFNILLLALQLFGGSRD